MNKELEQAISLISKEVMQQYESVRQSGVTNMFDTQGVACAAHDNDYHELVMVALDRMLYSILLQNFGALMEHYNIQQE